MPRGFRQDTAQDRAEAGPGTGDEKGGAGLGRPISPQMVWESAETGLGRGEEGGGQGQAPGDAGK